MELLGKAYLMNKLDLKRRKVLKRYNYYEMHNTTRDLRISTPVNLGWFMSVLGWCGKAVDALADRVSFREMRDDTFNMNEIFDLNNPDVLFDSAVLSAMISSCSFVYISPDETGYPRLQVIDGGNATGDIDPITGLLREGYAVLQRDDRDNVLSDAYFTSEYTEYSDGTIYKHNAGHPLLVPIIYRPDARRPFGHSRITRSCMSLMDSAARTIKRSEIAAEFYSFPQKYITGLSDDAEKFDKWQATISGFLRFDKDEDGDSPHLGQFTQQSMAPYTEQLKMLASAFAGETGLTMDDLGFATANPSSADAIKASHENLRLLARKAQKTFGSGFLNVGYVAACLRDETPYKRDEIYRTTPIWEPIFEPDMSTLSGFGDAILKINQSVDGYITAEKVRDMTGL